MIVNLLFLSKNERRNNKVSNGTNTKTRKKNIEQQLCRPEVLQDSARVVLLQKELAVLNQELKELYREWEVEQSALDKLLGNGPGV